MIAVGNGLFTRSHRRRNTAHRNWGCGWGWHRRMALMRNPLSGGEMRILDAHTHLSGPESGESAQGILACMDECGVDKAFVIAPLLDVHTWELMDTHLEQVRENNDYC